MPSQRHEVLVELLRRNPRVVLDLFGRIGALSPERLRAEPHSESFAQAKASPHAADLVLKLFDERGLKLGVVVEVQLEVDPDKLFTWPLYAVGLRAELRCDTCVLVVTPSGRVARWAESPIELGMASMLQPVVLGPDVVPALLDPNQASRAPGLAFFSALVYADGEPRQAAEAAFCAIRAARQFDHRLFTACYDILRASLTAAALAELETLMGLDVNQLQDETVRRNVARGEISAVLTFLEAREIELSSEQRRRIESCVDLETATTWVKRAAVIESADELFED